MELQIGENRVGISFESLMWFLALTSVGTVLGMVAYDYLFPYLPSLSPSIFDPSGVPPSMQQTSSTAPSQQTGNLRHALR